MLLKLMLRSDFLKWQALSMPVPKLASHSQSDWQPRGLGFDGWDALEVVYAWGVTSSWSVCCPSQNPCKCQVGCHPTPNPWPIQCLEGKDNVLLVRCTTSVTWYSWRPCISEWDGQPQDSYSSISCTCMYTYICTFTCIHTTHIHVALRQHGKIDS